jgi:hypothetical protein
VSKTKRVEIKVRRGDCLVERRTGLVTIPVASEDDLNVLTSIASFKEVTLSFEIPVPERVVHRLSESEFDEVFKRARDKNPDRLIGPLEIKNELFGSEAE